MFSQKKEVKELFTGIANLKVKDFNVNTGATEDGIRYAKLEITFIIDENNEFNSSLMIYDEVDEGNYGIKYLNQVGRMLNAVDENDVPDWFKYLDDEKTIELEMNPIRLGEMHLWHFIVSYTNLDPYSGENNVFQALPKLVDNLLEGDCSQLKTIQNFVEEKNENKPGTVIALLGVENGYQVIFKPKYVQYFFASDVNGNLDFSKKNVRKFFENAMKEGKYGFRMQCQQSNIFQKWDTKVTENVMDAFKTTSNNSNGIQSTPLGDMPLSPTGGSPLPFGE